MIYNDFLFSPLILELRTIARYTDNQTYMHLLISIGFQMRRKSLVNLKIYIYKIINVYNLKTFLSLYLLYLYFYDFTVKFHLFSLSKHIFNRNSIKWMCTKYERQKIMNIVGLTYFYDKDAMLHRLAKSLV